MAAPSYYANVNPDLLRWMPLGARRVLELGCGEAALAAAYKARNPRAHYTAVELHGPAATVARGRVDHLVEGDFTALDPAVFAGLAPFDLVVLGDVLEHMADPWAVLRKLASLMAPDAWLAISVPNVGHWTVLAEAMAGRWPAHDSGLFDRTHLRWFTLASLGQTLNDSGFSITRARPRVFPGDRAKAETWVPILADAAERAGLARQPFVERSQTLQNIVNARRADAPALEPLHVHFAAITPDFIDVRMRQPFEALSADPALTASWREQSLNLPDLAPDRAKVAVVQRLRLEAEMAARYVHEAHARGWIMVFELDDHPDLIGRVQRSEDVSRQLLATLQRFDAVQTSTPALAKALDGYGGPVRVFENAVMDLPELAPRRPGPIRVFHGALNREGFTGRVAASLGPLLATRADVQFEVVHDRAFFQALPTAAKRFHAACGYADYLALMAECDIVLSPLEGRPEEAFKSDVKFLEATRSGAAFVASLPVYAQSVEDGRTGLLVPEIEDWPRKLSLLIGDPDLRARLVSAARTEVRERRMAAPQAAQRASWYRQLWRDRAALADAARLRAVRS